LDSGYNLTGSVRTDRDRRMINSFDFGWHVGHAWLDALRYERIPAERLLALLLSGCDDANGVADRHCSDELLERVAQAWRDTYGKHAVPVKSQAEANDAGHLGKVGRITTAAVCDFFSEHPELSIKKLRSGRRADIVKTYTNDEISSTELRNLDLALELIEPSARAMGLGSTAQRLRVVDFRDEDILGTHSFDLDSETFRVNIARKNLNTVQATVRVIVHEVAHDCGVDGTPEHQHTEANLFSRIIAELALLPHRQPAAA